MKDYLIRAIDEEKTFRVFIATTTNLVEDARKSHNTSPTATAALGRTMTAAGIMGAMLKNEEDSVSIQIKGNGPIGTVLAVGKRNGNVKGYVDVPYVDLKLKENGKLNVGGAVGKEGKIVVIKDLGLKEPYIGQSNLVTGEIAEDLTHYFAYSEQQPSAVSLGVLIDKDLSVKASGGFIIQMLPYAPDEIVTKLENAIGNSEPISSLIDKGLSPEDILSHIFKDFKMDIIEKRDLRFKCDCSRERVESILINLGKKELKNMIDEDEKAEVVCHFCNTKYQFNKEELIDILETLE